jgi:hypothetical protein
VRGNILAHYGRSANYHLVAYSDPRQNGGANPNEAAPADVGLRDPWLSRVERVALDMLMTQDERMTSHQGVSANMNTGWIYLIEDQLTLKDCAALDVAISHEAAPEKP